MKKILLISCIIAVSLQESIAQISTEKRHYISGNIGAAIPIGAFASTSGKYPGYAKPGVDVYFEGAYYIKPYWGLNISVGTFQNTINKSAFERGLPSGYSTTYHTSNSGASWINDYDLIGPCFAIPLKKVTIDLKFLGGFVSTAYAGVTMDMTTNGSSSPSTITETHSRAYSAAYNIGAGARVNIYKKLALKVNVDFINCKPNIRTNVASTNQGTVDNYPLIFQQPIMSLNVSFGVAYQFIR